MAHSTASVDRTRSLRWRASRAWRAARTGFAFTALGLGALVSACTALPVVHLLVREREREQLSVQRLIHRFCRRYIALLDWLRVAGVRCNDEAALSRPGNLVVANHPTMLDVIALLAFMPQADCVVKQRFLENVFLGRAMRSAGYISNQHGPTVVEACVERLIRGRSVIIFPEGTRSPELGLGTFQRGAAHMALRSGRDPLPVKISSNSRTLTKGQHWWEVPERRLELVLEVGEPIAQKEIVGDLTTRGQAARALTAAMHAHFEKRMRRAGA